MFRMKPVMMFVVNILLLLLSWIFYKFPHGDEYLVLFVVPLIFILSPHVLTLKLTAVLFSLNLVFFIFYAFLGALNPIDVVVLTALLAISVGVGYLVKMLLETFVSYYRNRLSKIQHEYNDLVYKLEDTEQKGRSTENEFARLSRLYEVTKNLAPVLKLEDFFVALFGFLEDNFRFKHAHFLIFSEGEFSRAVSKSVGEADYHEEKEKILDYKAVVKYLKDQDSKPLFTDRREAGKLFDEINVRADTFLAFPLMVNDKISAVLAIEGAAKSSFPRFRILIPQATLELRKVEIYEQVQRLSIIDGLTEVYLRRYLMARLEESARFSSLKLSRIVKDAKRDKERFSLAGVYRDR